SILNASELTVPVTEEHVREIKEYLSLLDLTYDIDLVDYGRSGPGEKMTVMSQPGLRCAQAGAFVDSLREDDVIKSLNISYRNRILDRARNTVHGGIMEEIVQLETKLAKRDKKVFKLRFDTGEIDMVVEDEKAETCELYEIKYSTRRNDAQRKNLKNKDMCDKKEFSYGSIVGKYVIYRGDNAEEKGVTYLNVEDYLKSL
ncbi:MAG: ATP-binding protein, partial [Clostridia bacterium]|nr:ATP-binding protein [Clostridia bacterium]